MHSLSFQGPSPPDPRLSFYTRSRVNPWPQVLKASLSSSFFREKSGKINPKPMEKMKAKGNKIQGKNPLLDPLPFHSTRGKAMKNPWLLSCRVLKVHLFLPRVFFF
ncbi:Hypothetical protein Minf_2043 [Methylacidiphilum infernorum V4]|uniref:Uncharacterized protein n=1 Tax=Methylacidiphilum infernorum (isolate V4) TaxID=481448 RepID=B3DZ05_METI4|nr:Hypothetical protein Minf_2043 [Methylacidiphilum infernorum V4]